MRGYSVCKKPKDWFLWLKEKMRGLRVQNFLALLIAGIINAFGVTLFLFPVKLYDSGVSGVSMLLDLLLALRYPSI